ncbi:hypothetical protein JHK82_013914 [Glycine max]|uniref:EF-hand domain-containing protein n=3 Tax=Glycine subgen. Soja TaxID=1462606 RepID=A0A0R0K5I7_SOYBN|nr:hypothetical protein JHK85_014291 [Glycine max]KAG5058927.1 hypothetical protein JHK86_013923 [Glycine max]KAG5155945.1 hypothetical protein JHK82_013914 [Glycine max]KAH1079855.1 hypothetical protein GYH30_057002 [Glycine max]KRH60530.1 hypothetical protein GLYMA_05G245600v4 [Glycine max]
MPQTGTAPFISRILVSFSLSPIKQTKFFFFLLKTIVMATNPIEAGNGDAAPNPNATTKPSVYLQDTEELKRVFSRFDANCDGKISVTELDNVLRSLGSGVPPEDIQRVMDDLDTDHDGFINLSEFAAFCRSDTADGGDAELHDAFNLYDHDKNGHISATELCQVLNRLGMKCSVEECHNMIKSVDSDGDGNVNFPEFKRMMSNNRENASNGEEKTD